MTKKNTREPQDAGIEAIGGWIKEEDSSMIRYHRRLEEIDPRAFNPEYLAYFEDYRQRYFNDRLLPGQGVEEILGDLRKHGGTPEVWADLGAGVTTLFWSIGIDKPCRVIACDLVPEALVVLAKLKEGGEIPPCYHEAMKLVGRTREEFEFVRSSHWEYRVFDCHTHWILPDYENGFELITAIGCYGIASDAEHYRQAFCSAAANLRPGGRFIGADWIRSPALIEREGHNNTYLNAQLIQACAADIGFHLLSIANITIQGDPYYDSVLVWAFTS